MQSEVLNDQSPKAVLRSAVSKPRKAKKVAATPADFGETGYDGMRWRLFCGAVAKRLHPNPEPCRYCCGPGEERHHPDYRYPARIMWVCERCHTELHAGRLVQGSRIVETMLHKSLKPRVCKCGKQFKPKFKWQIWCSNRCGALERAKRYKERHAHDRRPKNSH